MAIASVSGKLICTINRTFELQADTVEFIETPDFPKLLSRDERKNCNINFSKSTTAAEKNRRLLIMPVNFLCTAPDSDDCEFDLIIKDNITFYHFDMYSYTNFQGFVLFDNWGGDGSCPLESISRESPFQFTDETQIIMLKSHLYEKQNRSHPCLWQFTAPDGFGFKLVITHLDISSATKFVVENSTFVITNQHLVQQNFPYYNNDNYLKISLSGNDFGNLTERRMEFEGYVSIIKNNFDEAEIDCFNETVGSTTTWSSNKNYTKGYPNNGRCTFDCIIKPHTEVIVFDFLNRIFIEKYADKLNYYPNGNDAAPVDYNLQPISIVLDSLYNGVDRHLKWEFVTDGSWQSVGFEMQFQEIVCVCADEVIIVPCSGTLRSHIMKNSDDFYCGNLNCTFSIQLDPSCSQTHIKLDIVTTLDPNNTMFDIFRVISNNITQLEVNNSNRNLFDYIIFLSAKNNNVFQAITVSSFILKKLHLDISAFNMPNTVDKITLDEENPYYAFSLCSKTLPYLFDIALSPMLARRNFAIEIYAGRENILDKVSFYKNSSISALTNFANCFTANSAFKYTCKTNSSRFSVLQYDGYYFGECAVLLFQSSSVYSDSCAFQQNVYTFNDIYNQSFTAMSKNSSKCTVFLMMGSVTEYFMESIWMSPDAKENLTIYTGTENKLIANIDTKIASSWHDIFLNSFIYIIKVPLNAAILINVTKITFFEAVNISRFPYYSVVTSPMFGTKGVVLCDSFDVSYSIHNQNVTFALLEYNVSSDVQYFFRINHTRINITSSFHSQKFANIEIEFHYECLLDDGCNSPFDIMMSIESIEKNVKTVSTKSTISKLPLITTTAVNVNLSNYLSTNCIYFIIILLILY